MGRPPKYDYDSTEWYTAITRLAMQGATDGEIAYLLQDEIGIIISEPGFLNMINGTYDKWTPEENARRSEKLVYVLAHARHKINSIVRGRYLKAALGGIITKNVTKRRMQIDGELTDNEIIQTTEIETPPNMQALSVWLYHHDDEWRRIEKKEEDMERIPEAQEGVDITKWIEKENAVRQEIAKGDIGL